MIRGAFKLRWVNLICVLIVSACHSSYLGSRCHGVCVCASCAVFVVVVVFVVFVVVVIVPHLRAEILVRRQQLLLLLPTLYHQISTIIRFNHCHAHQNTNRRIITL